MQTKAKARFSDDLTQKQARWYIFEGCLWTTKEPSFGAARLLEELHAASVGMCGGVGVWGCGGVGVWGCGGCGGATRSKHNQTGENTTTKSQLAMVVPA